MMHSVHVGRYQEETKDAVNGLRNMDVAVVEHGGGIKGYLKDEDSQGGWPEYCNSHEFDAHGEHDFDGVEPDSCGYIKIEIRVMHHV